MTKESAVSFLKLAGFGKPTRPSKLIARFHPCNQYFRGDRESGSGPWRGATAQTNSSTSRVFQDGDFVIALARRENEPEH
jgi:hypothetical protein